MKLKLPAIFSQRDPTWSTKLLGYNKNIYTIGSHGCLITSLGMYINKNPDEINTILKANQGFKENSGNFIWSKSTALGITEIYKSPFYSDPVTPQGLSKMCSLLDEGRPLLTHIDFDPRDPDDDQHWILVYGYDDNDVFYAADPWTGTLITLDVYGGVKRCVYEWRAYDKVLAKDEDLDYKKLYDEAYKLRNQYNDDRMALYEELGFVGEFNRLVSVERIRMLLEVEKKSGEKDIAIEELKKQLEEEKGKFLKAKEEIEDLKRNNIAASTVTDHIDTKVDQGLQKVSDIEKQVKEVEDAKPRKGFWETLIDIIFRRR